MTNKYGLLQKYETAKIEKLMNKIIKRGFVCLSCMYEMNVCFDYLYNVYICLNVCVDCIFFPHFYSTFTCIAQYRFMMPQAQQQNPVPISIQRKGE